MKKCPGKREDGSNCGAECPDDANFCEVCGYKFPKQENAEKGSFVGDKNVIAGDVVGGNLDRRQFYGNVTNNNTSNTSNIVTNNTTTNNTTTNIINQDESRKLVKCHVCNRNMIIAEAFTCKKCGKTICKNCRDDKSGLCLACYEETPNGKAKKLCEKADSFKSQGRFEDALELYKKAFAMEGLSKDLLTKINYGIGAMLHYINNKEQNQLKDQLLKENENALEAINLLIDREQECVEHLEKATLINTNYASEFKASKEQLDAYIELKARIEKKLSPEWRALSKAKKMKEEADVLLKLEKYSEALEFYLGILALENLNDDRFMASVNNETAVCLYRLSSTDFNKLKRRLDEGNVDENDLTTIQQIIHKQEECIKIPRKGSRTLVR